MVVVYAITVSIYLPHTSDGGHSPVEGNYVLLKVGCTIPNYICMEGPEDVCPTKHIVFIRIQVQTWLRIYGW